MFDLNNILRDNIKNLKPYSSARDEYSGNARAFLDANENPHGLYNRYPDPHQHLLKARLSEIKNISADQIFIGNGSDEIIDLCYRIFCRPGKDKAMTFSPGYGMYEVSARINDVELIRIPLDTDFQIPRSETKEILSNDSLKMIFICSPNNPSGNTLDHSAIRMIISHFQGIVIIDEAYSDFAETPSFLLELDTFPNLIVMQTLSKAWGMAGLRLGMAFSSPEIISVMNRVKPPYNISEANQKEALRLLEDTEIFQHRIDLIKKEKRRMEKELRHIASVESVFPSDANFLLVKVKNASEAYDKLRQGGIIVRNRHHQVENSIRITIGTPVENDLVLKILKE